MSWARTIATGSGLFALRVSIEGAPWDFVTHKAMEILYQIHVRGRYVGLKTDGLKLSEKCDLVRAKHEGQSIRITVADVARKATELFAKRPTKVAYLTADCDDDDTSITVTSTTGWDDGEMAYLDREAIAVTVDTGTAFDAERQQWDTLATYHYTADGESLRYPEVTDWPVLWEGRRVRLYAYGAGDDPQGDGTLIWIGVMQSPRFNGDTWTFGVDGLTRILDAELGSDLEDPCPIRGIYYPATAPLVITLTEYTSTARATALAWVTFAIAGFWETLRDFLVDLNVAIVAQLAAPDAGSGAFTQAMLAVEDGASWGVQFTTAATAHWMDVAVISAVDYMDPFAFPHLSSDPTARFRVVTASTSYIYHQADPVLGTVPRATFGTFSRTNDQASRIADAHKYNIDPTTYPPYRLYLGGVAAVTSATTAVNVEWSSTDAVGGTTGGVDPFTADVVAISAADRYVDVDYQLYTFFPHTGFISDYNSTFYAAVGEDQPKIRQGRSYGTGTLLDLITTLTGLTAEYVNTGAVPDLRIADFDFVGNEIEAAATGVAVAQRKFTSFAPITVRELIEPECQLIAAHPALASDGTITFRRVRLPSPVEITGKTITATSALVDEQWLTYEPSALGIFNTFTLRTGYDPIDDEYNGTTWNVRDVAAFGQCPQARTIEVAPKSESTQPFTIDDVVAAAARLLGVYGGRYAYLTIDVPLTKFSYLLGDVVSITWSKAPESDGTIGVTDKIGIIVEREWEPRDARGRLTLLVTDQRIGGYVPATLITSVNSGASGTTGPFNVTVDVTTYFPTGVVASDLWTSGDLIRLYKWNNATAGTVLGTITGATSTTLTFTTTSNWTPGSDTWAIGPRVSTSITVAGQKLYAYEAHSDALVDFSADADNPAFTFGP